MSAAWESWVDDYVDSAIRSWLGQGEHPSKCAEAALAVREEFMDPTIEALPLDHAYAELHIGPAFNRDDSPLSGQDRRNHIAALKALVDSSLEERVDAVGSRFGIPRWKVREMMREPGTTPTALYRYYDDAGRLLYVGITKSPEVRELAHSRLAPWWERKASRTMQWFDDRRDALDAETLAILNESPEFNIAGKVEVTA